MYMGSLHSGTAYLIHAVLVNHAAEDIFKAFLEKGARTKRFVGLEWSDLPPGSVEIMDTIGVVRK